VAVASSQALIQADKKSLFELKREIQQPERKKQSGS
jgi:hypothetical protein